MTIPEVRERLHALAAETGNAELASLADQLRRRYNGRKGRVVSKPITEEVAVAVRQYVELHPDEPIHTLATRFGINQGRVSEILFGKRS
jgi:hypothetical protein